MPLPNPGMSFSAFDPLTAAEMNDIVENVEALQDFTAYDLSSNWAQGWYPSGESWTYSSWDSTNKTGVITVPSNATTKYSNGMRIRISQATGGTKYFIITKVASTALTVYGGTDYTLNNETVSNPYFSINKAPFGFPLDPAKWTVTYTGSTVRSPTSSTSFQTCTDAITVPIGSWRLTMSAPISVSHDATGTTGIYGTLTLSSNASTETNPAISASIITDMPGTATGTLSMGSKVFGEDTVNPTTATTYTLMAKVSQTAQVSGVSVQADLVPIYLRAICAHL